MGLGLAEQVEMCSADQGLAGTYMTYVPEVVGEYRLRELCEQVSNTPPMLVGPTGAGNQQVSKIGHDQIETSKAGTIRNDFESVGVEILPVDVRAA